MSNGAAFANALAQGINGYIRGMAYNQQSDRQEKQDAQGQQLHDAKMQEILAAQAARQDDANFKEANRVAVSAGKTDGGYQITDAAGSNAFAKDADAAAVLGDMAAAKNTDVQNNAATRVSTGRTGATMQGTVAGSQVFQDPIKAQEFAKTQTMTDLMELEARRDVARQYGKMELADDIKAKIAKLDSEGAFKAFSLAQSGDLEGAAKAYQSTGQNRMPEGSFFKRTEVEDPATKIKRVVVSVMGKDGQPIVPDLDQALRSYLSPEARYNMDKGDRAEARGASKDAQTQSNWEKEFGLKQQDRRDTANYRSAVLGARQGAGSGQAGGASVGLKDRRDFLSDMDGLLGDAKSATTPEEAAGILQRNQGIKSQGDAIFRMNFELSGSPLTAPQVLTAMDMASKNPQAVKRMTDTETGKVYEWVPVNGERVIVGVGSAKQKDPATAPPAGAKAPSTPTESPAMSAANTKVLSQAGIVKTKFGFGTPEPAYNVQLPDGTTKIFGASELEAMGHPINRQMGKVFFDPNYRTK